MRETYINAIGGEGEFVSVDAYNYVLVGGPHTKRRDILFWPPHTAGDFLYCWCTQLGPRLHSDALLPCVPPTAGVPPARYLPPQSGLAPVLHRATRAPVRRAQRALLGADYAGGAVAGPV